MNTNDHWHATPAHARVTAAMERLQTLADGIDGMSIEFAAPLTPAGIAMLEEKYGLRLPPSYADFVCRYGAFTVHYGNELIGMEEPQFLRATAPDPDDATDGDDPEVAQAIDEALFFQRISHFAVDDYWCFNPRNRNDEGELEVVAYFHDEAFALAPREAGDAADFHDFPNHLARVVDEFIEQYSGE